MKNWWFRLFVLAILYAVDLAFRFAIVGRVAYPINYLAAIVFGGLTVGILFALFRQSKLILFMMILQVSWIIVHGIGLILWLWHQPPDLYDDAQVVLNVVQIVILLLVQGDDAHNFTHNFRYIGDGLCRNSLLRINRPGENR